MKSVTIVSGGMDSVTLAWLIASEGYTQEILSFYYGQRHSKELDFARANAARLGVPHKVVNLADLAEVLEGSSLTSKQVSVPDGHYSEENMRITVVPNRNAIMLSIAWGRAVAIGADVVAAAFHSGDHYIYPDCRPQFVDSIQKALSIGTEGFARPSLSLYTPFVNRTKADIVKCGSQLGVDYSLTWSCYKGGSVHCAACGTCTERIEAFRLAGVDDPTTYDPEGLKKYEALLASGKVLA